MARQDVDIPMREPTPEACIRCGRELSVRRDKRTGKPVTARGRAMLQCPGCGGIEIGRDPVSWQRRFRIVRFLIVGSTALFSLGGVSLELTQYLDLDSDGSSESSHSRWAMYLLIGFVSCLSAHYACVHAAYGLSPDLPMKDRVENWAQAAMFSTVLALFVWLTLGSFWPSLMPGH